MFLSQLKSPGGDRVVAARENDSAWIVPGARSTRDLALAAIAAWLYGVGQDGDWPRDLRLRLLGLLPAGLQLALGKRLSRSEQRP